MNEESAAAPIRAAIELESGEPLHGSLSSAAGERHRFVGWIELANAIERLRHPGAPAPPSYREANEHEE